MDVETLYSNQFVLKLRNDNVFDGEELGRLLDMLVELKSELAGSPSIDKPVALFLYTAPQMVYGVYSRLEDPHGDRGRQIQNAWLELDAIATDILAG